MTFGRRSIAVAFLAGCGSHTPAAPAPSASSSSSASSVTGAAPAAAASDRTSAILLAEQRRVAQGISLADQASRDPTVRRAAARALARIGGAPTTAGLLRALDDEDPEVIAWGAYGLGFWCKGREKETVSALVARALALPSDAPATSPLGAPVAVIARAIGKCGAEEAEPTLVAWLSGAPAMVVPAAFALGDLASAKQKLRVETLAALLNVAAGSAASPPVSEALFAIGRLEHPPLAVVDRVREVATARLAAAGDARLFAVRALGRAGEGSAGELARVLGTPASFTPTERSEAARMLGKMGRPGQQALAAALPELSPSPDPVALTGLVGDDFGVLLTAVEQLADASLAKKALASLASLPPPPGAPATILRRLSLVRCAAAKTLAGAAFQDKVLAACDVSGGGIGARAQVEVIGRDAIVGARLAAFRDRVHDPDVRAREAAIELIEKHEEIEGAAAILAEALGAKEGGVMATAAEVLAKQPSRATEAATHEARPRKKKGKKKVDIETVTVVAPAGAAPAVAKALLAALARPSTDLDPESATSLIDAAGALALAEAKPRVAELCASPYPTTREHAAKALALLGDKKACEAPADGGPPPAELDHLERAVVTLAIDSDAGALGLALDPAYAPVAVTRVADLVRAGFFDGIVVHRVVPGFVAQFGAPFGDGFGGPDGKPALRCETTPLPFAPLTVGVALAGRDTGSSQLFVTEGRYPHLDGLHAVVGTASGPWSSLAEGDVLRKVTIKP